MEMGTKQQVLEGAYSLLLMGGVARGFSALDEDGEPTSPRGENGKSFCVLGALARAAEVWGADDLTLAKALADVRRIAGLSDVPTTSWNDHFASDDEILETLRTAAGISEPVPGQQELLGA